MVLIYIASRLMLGIVYDFQIVRYGRALLYSAFMVMCGFSLLIASNAEDFTTFLLSVFIFGLSNSSMVSQRASIMGDILPSHQLSSAIGIGNFFQGIGLLSGPILAGKY